MTNTFFLLLLYSFAGTVFKHNTEQESLPLSLSGGLHAMLLPQVTGAHIFHAVLRQYQRKVVTLSPANLCLTVCTSSNRCGENCLVLFSCSGYKGQV